MLREKMKLSFAMIERQVPDDCRLFDTDSGVLWTWLRVNDFVSTVYDQLTSCVAVGEGWEGDAKVLTYIRT